jgi:hypothetical protein
MYGVNPFGLQLLHLKQKLALSVRHGLSGSLLAHGAPFAEG